MYRKLHVPRKIRISCLNFLQLCIIELEDSMRQTDRQTDRQMDVQCGLLHNRGLHKNGNLNIGGAGIAPVDSDHTVYGRLSIHRR